MTRLRARRFRRAVPVDVLLAVLVALAAGTLPLVALCWPRTAGVPRPRSTPAARPTSCCPTSGTVTFLGGINGRTLLLVGLLVCALGLAFGLVDLQPAQEPAGAPVDARGLGADLRDLQDLPADAGQVPADPLGVHRRGAIIGSFYFGRCCRARFPLRPGGDHPDLQPDRHRRQLRRGLVRHPGQHLRQLPHGLRRAQGQALSLLCRSRSRPA